MDIIDSRIDNGKAFDWGRVSEEYANYRDIYPDEFYRRIAQRGLCISGQRILDIGTGTGVLPRNMYRFGAEWTGTDISPEQIEQAKRLSLEGKMDIAFDVVSAENLSYPAASFDVITACQCFWYFEHKRVIPVLSDLLKPDGKLVILYMAWLPFEDRIAGEREKIVLKYSPGWSGAGETRRPIAIPDIAFEYFDLEWHDEYDLNVPFTRESWHGRMKACRGVGASLSDDELKNWEAEHRRMLLTIAPQEFDIKHYAAAAVLKKK